MSKKLSNVSDIFVQKLHEKVGKTLLREDVLDIWLASGGSKTRFPYGLSMAKNQAHIAPLGGNIWTIGSEQRSIDTYYWYIVNLLIRQYSPSGAIIAHEKSMECHLRNYEIPSCLVLYSRDTDKRIQIGEYMFHFRTRKTGEKSGSKNMYRLLLAQSEEIIIDGLNLKILGYEASLLDVASLRIHDDGIEESLILRFLQKYHTKLSREKLGELVAQRYIRALNRIRRLAKDHGYTELYNVTLDIIRREGGGCYLNL